MKTSKMKMVSAAIISFIAFATPSHAGEIGWFDSVTVASVDNAVGWVCENEDPTHTPSYGSLDVYINGPAGTGTLYGNYDLSTSGNFWGYYKAGVNAAGYCGTDSYVGFDLSGWFFGSSTTTIYVYWKDTGGNRTLLGGSPKTMTGAGTFY